MKRVSNKILGLSTDIKPLTGVRPGMEFIEQDNGKVFIWDGAKWCPVWAKVGPVGPTGDEGEKGATGSPA